MNNKKTLIKLKTIRGEGLFDAINMARPPELFNATLT